MKKKGILLIVFVCLVTAMCLFRVNQKYDRLARYQYEDEHARDLINRYLSDEDIDYLISYAIDPNTFIDYIGCNGFSLYHCELYNFISEKFWYASNSDVVSFCELLIGKLDGNIYEFIENHPSYSMDEISFYLHNYDQFELIKNPNNLNVEIGVGETVSNYHPSDLFINDEIVINKTVFSKYVELLSYLNETLGVKDCGLKVKNSYISYEDLEKLVKSGKDILLGKDIHQLGLALDLDLKNSVFNEKNIDVLNNALCIFGFVKEECVLGEYHIRYLAESECYLYE